MAQQSAIQKLYEEWTRAEIGVGAAIAAGNQEEKGICALLVISANPKNIYRKTFKCVIII